LKRNRYLLYAISCLQGMIFYGPIATLYRQAAGVSVFQITLIESISLALCIALEIPWGLAAERIGYKTTMVLCSALYLVSKVVFWRAAGFGGFLAERVLLAVVMAGLSGVDVSILCLSCRPEDCHRAMSVYDLLNTAGLLAASLVYARFVGQDYRMAALLTVCSYAAALLLTLPLREVRAPGRRKPAARDFAAALRAAAGDRGLPAFLLATALLGETHQTITVFLSQLQYVRAGLQSAAIGYLYTGVTLAGLLGGFSARAARRLGERRLAALLFGAAAAACLTLAGTASAVWSAVAVLVLRAAFSLYQPLQAAVQNRRVTGPNRATALSVNSAFCSSVGVGANLAFGALAQRRLQSAMLLGAALCLAGLWLLRASGVLRPARDPRR